MASQRLIKLDKEEFAGASPAAFDQIEIALNESLSA
jgi:hypothetical protein